MNKIEEKYQKHEVKEDFKEFIRDDIDLDIAIEELIRFIEKNKRKIGKDFLKNNAIRKIKKITQLLSQDNSIISLLEEDEKLLNEIMEHIDRNINYLKQIRSLITKSNYQELMKLVDFLVDYYIGNLNYLQSQRTSIEKRVLNITYIDGRVVDSRSKVDDFFKKTIINYQAKPIENKKKI